MIRSTAIIGQTVKPNGRNMALSYAVYFFIYQELEKEARQPTNEITWNGAEDYSYAPPLA